MKKCPYCDTSNFDNATFCENCGMPLKPGMKISCPRCGKLVREHDKYCKACGAYLLEDKACPSCGNKVLATDAFCAQCGTDLSGEDADAVHNVVAADEIPASEQEIQATIHENVMEEEIDDDLESVAESILSGAAAAVEETVVSDIGQEDVKPAVKTRAEGREVMAVEAEINNYLMEGGSFMAEEKYGDAIKSFSRAIGTVIKNGLDKEEDRRLITLYLRRGEAFKLTGDSDRALDNFSRALKYAQSIFAVSEVERIKNLIAGM